MNTTTDILTGATLAIGDRVVRTQGRPASVGRTGILMTIHNSPDAVGSAGDVLVTVIDEQSGTTFQCYSRQLAHA